MKKSHLKKLIFKKSVVSTLTKINGGDFIPVTTLATQFEGCLSLAGHYTCETGLQPTCDHSYRICPVVTALDC